MTSRQVLIVPVFTTPYENSPHAKDVQLFLRPLSELVDIVLPMHRGHSWPWKLPSSVSFVEAPLSEKWMVEDVMLGTFWQEMLARDWLFVMNWKISVGTEVSRISRSPVVQMLTFGSRTSKFRPDDEGFGEVSAVLGGMTWATLSPQVEMAADFVSPLMPRSMLLDRVRLAGYWLDFDLWDEVFGDIVKDDPPLIVHASDFGEATKRAPVIAEELQRVALVRDCSVVLNSHKGSDIDWIDDFPPVVVQIVQSYDVYIDLLRRASVFVMWSIDEGCPHSLFEALMARCIIVVPDRPWTYALFDDSYPFRLNDLGQVALILDNLDLCRERMRLWYSSLREVTLSFSMFKDRLAEMMDDVV